MEIFDKWGVHNRKVQLIINKYSSKSVDKLVIKDFFKEYEIAGYISFSDKYEEYINTMNSKIILDNISEYYSILEKQNFINNYEYKRRFFSIKDFITRLKTCKINNFKLKNT